MKRLSHLPKTCVSPWSICCHCPKRFTLKRIHVHGFYRILWVVGFGLGERDALHFSLWFLCSFHGFPLVSGVDNGSLHVLNITVGVMGTQKKRTTACCLGSNGSPAAGTFFSNVPLASWKFLSTQPNGFAFGWRLSHPLSQTGPETKAGCASPNWFNRA